jgi:hypothetical protein
MFVLPRLPIVGFDRARTSIKSEKNYSFLSFLFDVDQYKTELYDVKYIKMEVIFSYGCWGGGGGGWGCGLCYGRAGRG